MENLKATIATQISGSWGPKLEPFFTYRVHTLGSQTQGGSTWVLMPSSEGRKKKHPDEGF
jgi:hypothetical protein